MLVRGESEFRSDKIGIRSLFFFELAHFLRRTDVHPRIKSPDQVRGHASPENARCPATAATHAYSVGQIVAEITTQFEQNQAQRSGDDGACFYERRHKQARHAFSERHQVGSNGKVQMALAQNRERRVRKLPFRRATMYPSGSHTSCYRRLAR
jgi:hypothetical protein